MLTSGFTFIDTSKCSRHQYQSQEYPDFYL